jgi:type II secretory pathway pseudopilin PulG
LDGSSRTSPKDFPLPEGLELLGKQRKEFGQSQRPARAERAGASESLGQGEGKPRLITQHQDIFAEALSLDPRPSTLDPASRAFTIIEIALCLGIIAFALVAIIGALPTGLNVQKNNREQTIVGQDATVWMDLLRSGAQGYDDLTNYVIVISNQWAVYKYNGNPSSPQSPLYGLGGGTRFRAGTDYYTYSNSSVPGVVLTNGATIIGLLSIPTWTSVFPGHPAGDYQSNYIIAYVRSMSGATVEKAPQSNPTVLQDAFTYRMIVQNFPYAAVDTNGFCMACFADTNGLTAAQLQDRINAAYSQWLLETNTHDFRLLFRWPVLPNGQIPNYGRYTFRQMVNGGLIQSNNSGQLLYYVQPSVVYSQIPDSGGQRVSPQ